MLRFQRVPRFAIKQSRADAHYLWRYFSRVSAWEDALGLSTGGTPTSRNRLKEEKFLAMKNPSSPASRAAADRSANRRTGRENQRGAGVAPAGGGGSRAIARLHGSPSRSQRCQKSRTGLAKGSAWGCHGICGRFPSSRSRTRHFPTLVSTVSAGDCSDKPPIDGALTSATRLSANQTERSVHL